VKVYDGVQTCDTAKQLKENDYVMMHYTGTIDKDSKTGVPGQEFDSSRGHGQTFDFELGVGEVIPGWDRGLLGLCIGAKAILTIPPELAYGKEGVGDDIPGGATLSFDVEVVNRGQKPHDYKEIDAETKEATERNLFKEIDTDRNRVLTKDEVRAHFKGEGVEGLTDKLWEEEDKNKDGIISWDEFSGPKGHKDEL